MEEWKDGRLGAWATAEGLGREILRCTQDRLSAIGQDGGGPRQSGRTGEGLGQEILRCTQDRLSAIGGGRETGDGEGLGGIRFFHSVGLSQGEM
jgi:hypothetical protein